LGVHKPQATRISNLIAMQSSNFVAKRKLAGFWQRKMAELMKKLGDHVRFLPAVVSRHC
jgi:hypothetical protein